jgi:chaperonin GroES
MPVEPLGKHIAIERAPPNNRTPGGLFLPDGSKHRPCRGTVKAIGPEVRSSIKIGDEVYYEGFTGTPEMKLSEDEKYVFIAEKHLLCLVEK